MERPCQISSLVTARVCSSMRSRLSSCSIFEDAASEVAGSAVATVDHSDMRGVPYSARYMEVIFTPGGRRVKIVTGRTVSGPTLRLPRSKRANVRANVYELLCRHRDGLPIADRELRRVEGRLQYLRTQGHPREADVELLLGAVVRRARPGFSTSPGAATARQRVPGTCEMRWIHARVKS
jgi:hypothetical protein